MGSLPTCSTYCSTLDKSTGFSLNEMMLGSEALLPLELAIGQAEPARNSTTEYAAKLTEQVEQIHQHLKLSSNRQKRNFDHFPINQHQYYRGDAVWLCRPQRENISAPS